jgi:hypothetical protein
MYQRTLKGYEKALGPDHALTINTASILGNLYADQGKLKESKHMLLQALVRFEDGTCWWIKTRLRDVERQVTWK